MKAAKGKLLKKLKTVKAIGYLRSERILQVNALDFYSNTRAPLVDIHEHPKKHSDENFLEEVQRPEIIDVSELMKDLEEDQEPEFDEDDKENVRTQKRAKLAEPDVLGDKGFTLTCKERKTVPLSEIDIASFRPPDMNSGTLFDPNLLAAFEQAVMEVKARVAVATSRIESPKSGQYTEHPLHEFPHKSPPGGSESVILYTTSLRGIRKTFVDCQKVKSLLQNLKLLFFERDVSMHSKFKQELWGMLGLQVVPPRLFVKGRYIGGAEEILSLHEQEKFKLLVEGIPVDINEGPCEGCAGFKFIICFNCNGGKRFVGEGGGESKNCLECNENGMLICPFCC